MVRGLGSAETAWVRGTASAPNLRQNQGHEHQAFTSKASPQSLSAVGGCQPSWFINHIDYGKTKLKGLLYSKKDGTSFVHAFTPTL